MGIITSAIPRFVSTLSWVQAHLPKTPKLSIPPILPIPTKLTSSSHPPGTTRPGYS
jgi:hypothetical protein